MQIKLPIHSSYNIAPTHNAYVVTNDNPHELQRYMWGLIPSWANDALHSSKLINARSENIASKPSFRMSVRKRRCLVLADGFYEWKKVGKQKQPYRITYAKPQLMIFAGIWDSWVAPSTGREVRTFSIITTIPNEDMKTTHSRMPVILPTLALQEQWLQEKNLLSVLNLLQPLEDGLLNIYPVSKKVNSPLNDSADLLDEIQMPPTLF